MSFAVVGLGDWGTEVAGVLQGIPGAALHALYDANADVVHRLPQRFPGVRAAASFDEILGSAGVDAVVVGIPLPARRAVTRLALASGRHVFVRAPPASNREGVSRLATLAERSRRRLFVGDQNLEHAAFRRLMDTAASGDLGVIEHIQAESQRPGVRHAQDVLESLGPEQFTAVLALVREHPAVISAYGRATGEHEMLDFVGCHLRFPSGIAADIRLSCLGHREIQYATVIGSERTATYDALERTVTVYEWPHTQASTGDSRYTDTGIRSRLWFAEPPRLNRELEAFVASVRGDADALGEIRDIVRSGEILDAVRRLIEDQSNCIREALPPVRTSPNGAAASVRSRSLRTTSSPPISGRPEHQPTRTTGQKCPKSVLIHTKASSGEVALASAATTTQAGEQTTRQRSAVLVDVHPLWLEAVARVLSRAGVKVVGTAATGEKSLDLLAATAPDILVVELWPGGRAAEGFGWVTQARTLVPHLKLAVLSSFDDDEHIDAAFAASADVYILKTAPADDLEAAIRQMFERSVFIRRRGALGEPPPDRGATVSGTEERSAGTAGLTRRELEILRLVAMGHSNSALAAMLWVTDQTIKFHLSNIYRKTGTANRTAASRWALAQGLLDELDPADSDYAATSIEVVG